MDHQHSEMIADAACHEIQRAGYEWTNAAVHLMEPSVLYRPQLYVDGNQWCALYGKNIQDGVAGFGDSPQEAMVDFNKAFAASLTDTQER